MLLFLNLKKIQLIKLIYDTYFINTNKVIGDKLRVTQLNIGDMYLLESEWSKRNTYGITQLRFHGIFYFLFFMWNPYFCPCH